MESRRGGLRRRGDGCATIAPFPLTASLARGWELLRGNYFVLLGRMGWARAAGTKKDRRAFFVGENVERWKRGNVCEEPRQDAGWVLLFKVMSSYALAWSLSARRTLAYSSPPRVVPPAPRGRFPFQIPDSARFVSLQDQVLGTQFQPTPPLFQPPTPPSSHEVVFSTPILTDNPQPKRREQKIPVLRRTWLRDTG